MVDGVQVESYDVSFEAKNSFKNHFELILMN